MEVLIHSRWSENSLCGARLISHGLAFIRVREMVEVDSLLFACITMLTSALYVIKSALSQWEPARLSHYRNTKLVYVISVSLSTPCQGLAFTGFSYLSSPLQSFKSARN